MGNLRAHRHILLRAAAMAALGCASSAPPQSSTPRAAYVDTGDPLPESPVHDAQCRDAEPGATRWLASQPHSPLMIADSRGIQEAGQPCCAPWSRRGSRWLTIGPHGDVVGEAVITGGEGYDVTQCYELALATSRGDAGVGLFASTDGPWKAVASRAWEASESERAGLEQFVKQVQGEDLPVPVATALYFHASGARYAAVGGTLLVVARLDEQGRWVSAPVDSKFVEAETGTTYQPLAVLDVDGDGTPELVFHWDAGDGWADTVLRFDPARARWLEVATSIGGSTA